MVKDDDAQAEAPQDLQVVDQSAFAGWARWCTHLAVAAPVNG